MLKISTARSTTQINEGSRRGSEQVGQGEFSVRPPQVSHNRTRARALRIVSASCWTAADSVCTRCKAIRSAERGPMPGSFAKALISALMGSGRAAMGDRRQRLSADFDDLAFENFQRLLNQRIILKIILAERNRGQSRFRWRLG